MALGYPGMSQPNATSGSGTSLIGTYWIPALEESLATPTNFLRFADTAVADVPLMTAGNGQQVNFSYIDPLAVDGAALSEGTRTTDGSQDLIARTATVAEYGRGLNLSGFQGWLTNPGWQPASMANYYEAMTAIRSLTNWSIETADYLCGDALKASGTTNFINLDGTSTALLGTATSGGGTAQFTAANIMEMQAGLLGKGIAGRAELGGRWAVFGGAGAFNKIRLIDGIQRDAATLGIQEMYAGGFQFAWQNFVFFDLLGATANTLLPRAASGTVGTSVLVGGGALVHDNTIGGAFTVNSPSWMAFYPDYGQDNGRVQRLQANFKALTALTVNTEDKHRTWLIRSYQGD